MNTKSSDAKASRSGDGANVRTGLPPHPGDGGFRLRKSKRKALKIKENHLLKNYPPGQLVRAKVSCYAVIVRSFKSLLPCADDLVCIRTSPTLSRLRRDPRYGAFRSLPFQSANFSSPYRRALHRCLTLYPNAGEVLTIGPLPSSFNAELLWDNCTNFTFTFCLFFIPPGELVQFTWMNYDGISQSLKKEC